MEVCSCLPFRRLWTLTGTATINSRLNLSQVNTHAILWGIFLAMRPGVGGGGAKIVMKLYSWARARS